jgi:spermidine synthase
VAIAIVVSLALAARQEAQGARVMARNFYGLLRVVDGVAPNVVQLKGAPSPSRDDIPRFEKLMNGTIDHGLQFLSSARRREATTYYGPDSGIGLTLKAAGAANRLNVGVIGLGVGTLATYGRRGDSYKFYEINPLVIQLAKQEFTFLRDSEANVNIVPGDGRRSLEQETTQAFDVLVVDAFSGDAIPVHLLTREAFQLYFRHLKPEGVLAVHISNQYLDLAPVVTGASTWLGKEAVMVTNKRVESREIYSASWVLVGSRQGFLGKSEIEKAGTPLAPSSAMLWTDDYSSLLKLLRL